MQPNQINQQLNTYFIQAGQSLQNPNLFQQLRVPSNNSNFHFISQLPNTITVNQPLQVNQSNQRFESKPNEGYIIQNRPMIINTNSLGFNQRFISPANIVNQGQLNQIQKFSSVQPQIQIQQPQQQQQQSRPVSAQIQRIITNPISDNQVIEIKDNTITPVVANTTSVNLACKQQQQQQIKIKEDVVEEREEPVNTKDMVNSNKINQIVRQIDDNLQLDEDMKGIFRQYLDEFLQHVTENACTLAKLRNSNSLEMKDFQYVMEKDWNIYVPGYPSINEKPKPNTELEIHRTRMNIIKKLSKQ